MQHEILKCANLKYVKYWCVIDNQLPKQCKILVCDSLSDDSLIRNTQMWHMKNRNTQIFGHALKKAFSSHRHAKNHQSTEMPICVILVASTCMPNITRITAHTTMLPTRYRQGKTRFNTGFDLDSFGQEMPSLVLVKVQYFHSSFHFGILVVVFSARATRLTTRVIAREKNVSIGEY